MTLTAFTWSSSSCSRPLGTGYKSQPGSTVLTCLTKEVGRVDGVDGVYIDGVDVDRVDANGEGQLDWKKSDK